MISSADQQNIFADDNSIAYVRGSNLNAGCSAGERIVITATKASTPVTLHISTAQTALAQCSHFTKLFPQEAPAVTGDKGAINTVLPADGFAIFRATK